MEPLSPAWSLELTKLLESEYASMNGPGYCQCIRDERLEARLHHSGVFIRVTQPDEHWRGGLSPSSMADYHDEFLRAQGAGSAALYAMIGESIGEALTNVNVMADRAIDSINRLDG